jgi:hypothetical protein
MITPQTILAYVKTERFRPFRIRMASGRTFEIRHPEMVKVLRSSLLAFSYVSESPNIPDEWESVSLMLTESVSYLETPVA